jgi:hypothetical protein
MSYGDNQSPTIIKIGTRKSQVHGFIMVYVTQYSRVPAEALKIWGYTE